MSQSEMEKEKPETPKKETENATEKETEKELEKEEKEKEKEEKTPTIEANFTYSANLWDKFEMLQKNTTDKRKLIDDVINLLQDRVEIEDNYAKGLEKLSNQLSSFLDKG